MDYQKLIAELVKPEYSGLNDYEAAIAINSKKIIIRDWVPNSAIKQALMEFNIWPILVINRNDISLPLPVRSLCISILDWIEDPSGKIGNTDLDRESVQNMISGLVFFGIATQYQANEIFAMANKEVLWIDLEKIGTVGEGHVQSAREIINGAT